jgi:hypothetical protein
MVTVSAERAHREAMWAELLAQGGPRGVSPTLVRRLGAYRGARGVWVDTQRTRIVDGATGITVGLLHTGKHYADDLSADGVLYHYPRTLRPGQDRADIAATKTAAQLNLSVFVVTCGKPASTRNVYKGWVEGWDDDAELFLVTFAEDPPPLPVGDDGNSPFVLEDEISRGMRLVLCALHHLAYDRGLWAIHPSSLAVTLRPGGPDAGQLRITRNSLWHLPKQPHQDALEAAWSSWRPDPNDL